MVSKTSKMRPREGKSIRISDDLVWGINPVFEGMQQEPQRFSEILLVKDKRSSKVSKIIEQAKKNKVKLTFVASLIITGEGSSTIKHQGIVAKRTSTELIPFRELLDKLNKKIQAKEHVCVMVCDSLQDPHNLGAIIRSALASGASAVLVTRERSAPIGGSAAKSSAGAISHIDICQVTNLVSALNELKEIGFWVFGAVKDEEARSIYETDFSVPSCLVVGSEGKGIRPLVKKKCDGLITIPMVGELDSLNSSAAAAVILFEAMRQNMITLK